MRDSGFHPFNGRVSRHFGDSLKPEDPYLSYHDVRLMKEDIDTLKDDWLTDNSIAFWEEYLEREYLTQYPNAHIVLLRPSMSFMLTQTPDPLTLKEALPDFSRTSHIFLPINDCRNPAIAEGGSHWSLLLVSVVDGAAFHYDSMWPSNESSAALAAEKMSKLLGKRLVLKDLEDAPQQENSSDCGVFVCVLMRHLLLAKLLKAARGERVGMSMGDKAVDAHRARKEILSIIENFRREGEKRRRQVFFPALGLVFASMPSNRTSASREPMLMFITAEAQVHMGIPRPTRKVEVRHGLTEALRISMTTEHDQ